MAMQHKIANAARVLKGKVKEAAGRATRSPRLVIEGKLDQGAGRLRQAGENIRDSGRDIFRP
ncbi:MAG TPA: CsbD family protein [Pseudonocardiaceae bacterium]|nr:CsbD family protein [Pseudonocardiaceae bacterium]